jgi:hypothetical protein
MFNKTVVYDTVETDEKACNDKAETSRARRKLRNKAVRSLPTS